MKPSIQVLEAKDKNHCLFWMIIFSLTFLMLYIHVVPDFAVDPVSFAACLFGIMVYEDAKYQTIDIRLCAILFVLAMLGAPYTISVFFYNALVGFIAFRLWFLLSIYRIPVRSVKCTEANQIYHEPLQMGLLPCLAGGMILWLVLKVTDISSLFLFHTLYISIHDAFLFLSESRIFYLCLFTGWAGMELRHWLLLKNKINIGYGLGDGDPYVLAIWTGFFSLIDMFFIFGLTLIVQLIVMSGKYIRDHVYIGGILK
jgi:hypothetical protein